MSDTRYPDDWGEGYETCARCGQRYHTSGTLECECKMIDVLVTIPIKVDSKADLTLVLEAAQATAANIESDLESDYDIRCDVDIKDVIVKEVK